MTLYFQCYVLTGSKGEQYPKAKGVQLTSTNAEALTFENYKKVLLGDAEALVNVHNITIRVLPNVGVVTGVQEKVGLSRCSFKRIYTEDGDSEPLSI